MYKRHRNRKPDLSMPGRLVLLAIIERASSHDQLVKRLGITRASVRQKVDILSDKGLVTSTPGTLGTIRSTGKMKRVAFKEGNIMKVGLWEQYEF